VLCANYDAWRLVGRGLPGHRRFTPSGGSSACLKTCSTDDPKIVGGFTRPLAARAPRTFRQTPQDRNALRGANVSMRESGGKNG
jgi:hypothetical protein